MGQLYNYPKAKLYTENINKSSFEYKDIAQLYEWKNGSRLSQKKQVAFDTKIAAHLTRINELKQEIQVNQFRAEFVEVSAIWKIFLLHIIAPQIYPIFDQHVFRAYIYLSKQALQEIPFSNVEKEHVYFDEYLAFFNRLAENAATPRKQVDEALFSFGRFLKTIYGHSIHSVTIDTQVDIDAFE